MSNPTPKPSTTVRVPRDLYDRAQREAVRLTVATGRIHQPARVLIDAAKRALGADEATESGPKAA